ncbi:sensor histidine kinase [Streptomyces sp. NPDC056149]|uniref:sensor histidine kinase n=1 Tax=Streptomyces sp. NPDC056149 TaxID=3345728 RepID=UPI0035E0E751
MRTEGSRAAAGRHASGRPPGTRPRTVALAPVRGLALWALDAAGLVLLAATLITAQATYLLGIPYVHVTVVERGRALTDLTRRLAGIWSAVPVPIPYHPRPAPPRADADGLHRYQNKLYRSAWMPHHKLLVRWIVNDDASWRDLAWLLLAPLSCGPLAALPAALIGAGAVVAAAGAGALHLGDLVAPLRAVDAAGAWLVPAGVLLAVVGCAAGPALLRCHAAAARLLLAPCRRSRYGAAVRAVMRSGVALHRLTVLIGVAVAEWAMFAFLTVAFVVLHVLGLAVLWWELVAAPARRLVEFGRRLVRDRTGLTLPAPYLPEPPPPRQRADGLYRSGKRLYTSQRQSAQRERVRWIRSDVATWRDLVWLATDPLLVALVVLPLTLPALIGVFALLWPWLWWPLAGPFLPYDPAAPWHALLGLLPGDWSALSHPAFGVLLALPLIALSGVLAEPLLRLHTRWAHLLLAPTGGRLLAQRVEELTETRTIATHAQAAELRRIERDLHDGSQARLLAIGLKLNTVKNLVDSDPAAAKQVVGEIQEAAAQALAELRDLVRGIHPPVLAERGLGDAVRALAMDSPLDVAVHLELTESIQQPLETAVYLAVSELLSNVTKHASATRVAIDLVTKDGALAVTVTDDGRGGAAPGPGSGLSGIARRLTPFDGTLSIVSPLGGPTTITLNLPLVGARSDAYRGAAHSS